MKAHIHRSSMASNVIQHEQESVDAIIFDSGRAYIECEDLRLTARGEEEGRFELGLMILSVGKAGIFAALSVEAMRDLSKQLLFVADQIEGEAARKTAEVFDRLGKQGGV